MGRVVSQGVLIVKGIRARDGRREILAVEYADTESETTWGELFHSLKERGLSGVKLLTSDAHTGIKAAVFRHFQGAFLAEMPDPLSARPGDQGRLPPSAGACRRHPRRLCGLGSTHGP